MGSVLPQDLRTLAVTYPAIHNNTNQTITASQHLNSTFPVCIDTYSACTSKHTENSPANVHNGSHRVAPETSPTCGDTTGTPTGVAGVDGPTFFAEDDAQGWM